MTYVITILAGVLLVIGAVVLMLLWDKGRRSCVLAVRSLWLHKLRSMLSVIGIIIGTGAVIVLMGFGEGSMQDALEDIKRQGATNIIIRSVRPPDDASTQTRSFIAAYGLTNADYERFKTISTVTRLVPMRIFPQEIKYLNRLVENGRVVGTTPEYTDVNEVRLARGRFLTWDEDHYQANVCVLGSGVADKLFPFEDPVDKTVKLGSYFYRVVGVLHERMKTGALGGTSQAGEDYNNDAYIPLKTCEVRFGRAVIIRQSGSVRGEKVELHQVTLTISDMDKVRPTGEVIKTLLDNPQLHAKQGDYAVTVPLERLEEAERARDRYTFLLLVIASISLVVGGIGIMNIMLATVTERTREIGIRRALGAKRRDITLQFLIEAIVQTALGGLIGVVGGVGLVFLVPVVAKWFTTSPTPVMLNTNSIFYSVAVSIGVGVLFGWYPARRAALLDPIEALRHE